MTQSSRGRDREQGVGKGMMILSITTSGYWVLGSPSLGSQEPKGQKPLGWFKV